jgi:hypothetical protein
VQLSGCNRIFDPPVKSRRLKSIFVYSCAAAGNRRQKSPVSVSTRRKKNDRRSQTDEQNFSVYY